MSPYPVVSTDNLTILPCAIGNRSRPNGRTVKIVDIAGESATQPPVSVKIASVTAIGVGGPDATRFSADSIEATDVEVGMTAVAAMFDPAEANDDRYYLYRQITAGTDSLSSAPGLTARIDGLTVDEVGVRPSRLQLLALLAMLPPPEM